jgi:hypothetical protein
MRTAYLAGLFPCLAACAPPGAFYGPEFPPENASAAPRVERVARGEVAVGGDDDDDAAPPTPLQAAAAVPLSARDRPHPDPVFFHIGAGYGALGGLDLTACRDRGLPSGYIRIRATFRASGRVAHAAVESASEPSQEALTCIGEQLQAASVPSFDSDDVTLSRIVFVN